MGRFERHEPTFGRSDSSSLGKANPTPATMGASSDADLGNMAAGDKPGRNTLRTRQSNPVFSLLAWLIALAALGYGAFYGYQHYVANIVALEEIDADVSTGGFSTADVYDQPPADYKGALNIGQLRWCFREELRIGTLRELVSTTNEVNTVNNMHADYLSRCDISLTEQELVAQAQGQVSERQAKIIADTRDQQLLILDAGDSATWRRSELVAQIQQSLDTLGYDVGSIDGLYGNQTKVAIKAFERDFGLEQTGLASYAVLEKLREELRQSNN